MLHKEFGLISIIMAAYNAEKTIELAIESVLNQTYSNFELLVINDCSRIEQQSWSRLFLRKTTECV